MNEEEIDVAQSLIASEVENQNGNTPLNTASKDVLARAWDRAYSSVQFLPGTKNYGIFKNAKKQEKLRALQQEFAMAKAKVVAEEKKCTKQEQRLEITLKGYILKAGLESNLVDDTFVEIAKSKQDLSSFEMLRLKEIRGAENRIEKAGKELEEVRAKEQYLHKKYAALMEERERIGAILQV